MEQEDARLVLAVANDMFAGHVSKDAVIVAKYEPNELPWLPRAVITILLNPEMPGSRCGVVDLLHPSELYRPRCGASDCRCMQKS